jgi:hypothetical protein
MMPKERKSRPRCVVSGCVNESRTAKLCQKHYQQHKNSGIAICDLSPIPKEKKCSFEGCGKPLCAKGLCNSHWAQQKRGHPLTPILTDETPEERFWRNIKKMDSGCWYWTGAGAGKGYEKGTGEHGYGQLRIHGNSWMAHRWAYEYFKNEKLQTEDTLDHLCRNTRCCNPEHLERVTLTENVDRRNLYWALTSENRRFREFFQSVGINPNDVLGGTVDANLFALSRLSAVGSST